MVARTWVTFFKNRAADIGSIHGAGIYKDVLVNRKYCPAYNNQ